MVRSTLVSPYIDSLKVAPHYLFPKKVCYVGEQIAVVVAESPYAAVDGVDAVEVDYEPLPVVATWKEAVKPDAPRVHSGFDNIVAHLKHEFGEVGRSLPRSGGYCRKDSRDSEP